MKDIQNYVKTKTLHKIFHANNPNKSQASEQ